MAVYEFNGSLEIGIWAYRAAGWQLATTQSVFVWAPDQSYQENKYMAWAINNAVYQLGSDVQKVGITIESYTGNSAAFTAFSKLAWQAQGSSGGTRSATPNGEKTTVTVTP